MEASDPQDAYDFGWRIAHVDWLVGIVRSADEAVAHARNAQPFVNVVAFKRGYENRLADLRTQPLPSNFRH